MTLITGTTTNLEAMLLAKENRYNRQLSWLDRWQKTLVSITINMPGSIKDSWYSKELLDFAVAKVTEQAPVLAAETVYLATGPEALLSVDAPGASVKEICATIEGASSFGRLLDIDVFTAEGELLSAREQRGLRRCFVCNEPALFCMREASHSQADIRQGVEKLLYAFLAERSKKFRVQTAEIGALAVEAMLYEVSCTPSPGLVNRYHSGAHQDMDFYTFMASSAALSSYMTRFAEAGWQFPGELSQLLPVLRLIGIEAEQAMFRSTQGVNTQKGLIFSLGIVAAAAGYLQRQGKNCEEFLYKAVATVTQGLVAKELAGRITRPEEKLTAGERLYKEYQVAGIRGEMEAGLPAIRQHAMPQLKQSLDKGLSLNDALGETLLCLMTCVDDTTVMNRHSPEVMRCWVKEQVEPIFTAGGLATKAGKVQYQAMEDLFVKKNISPGGAADLLAVTWFLYQLFQKKS
ncbi:MAG: triphosphoribosyl-dephospho-CoA synthase CitG [Sporomusaceae bacterium]|nr:triphosphoribosyl-dephospho-CoA synthase CitG [Sporomusaceae bacterium]